MSSFDQETARLDALHKLNLLDTSPSETFDRITRTASHLFNLPIAAISLTDSERQWFKSRVGVVHWSIPRDKAPCAEVAEKQSLLVIPDLLADPGYATSMLAEQGIRFYAGAPLVTREGHGLGALCVLGTEPRSISQSEITALQDMAQMVMSQIELQHAFGRVDPLSALPNRLQFFDDLDDLAKDESGECRLVVVVDLARSDQINSGTRVMGATYIDNIVNEGARLIRGALGPHRQVYHVGPTFFAFLAPRNTPEAPYLALLHSVLERIAGESALRFVMTAAIGVTSFVVGSGRPLDVLRQAQSAALDARNSESGVSLYSFANDDLHKRRFAILNCFGSALEQEGQLRLVFQPRVDLATGMCVGVEALLRWTDPVLGSISPGEFIPIVEQTSLARPMTTWVLDRALQQLALWHAAGSKLTVSVNVSASNLEESDFSQRVERLMLKYRIPTEYLEIEITESSVMQKGGSALSQLNALNAAGIQLAIDDFGTGQSSLAYLQRLPVHVVKIDRAFICEIAEDDKQRTLAKSMITLCHDLGYRVVAEGAETSDVVDILRNLRCDEVQGYYFGRPMEAAVLERWLSEGRIALDNPVLCH